MSEQTKTKDKGAEAIAAKPVRPEDRMETNKVQIPKAAKPAPNKGSVDERLNKLEGKK